MKYPIQEIDDATMAFPANVEHLMPKWQDIPGGFKNGNMRTEWNQLVSAWFFRGLSSLKLVPMDGVDTSKAMRHLSAIMRSYEPKHEHKEAAVAYLMSLWFEPNPEWEAKPRENK